jgi:hypothetical protein
LAIPVALLSALQSCSASEYCFIAIAISVFPDSSVTVARALPPGPEFQILTSVGLDGLSAVGVTLGMACGPTEGVGEGVGFSVGAPGMAPGSVG